MIEADEIHWPKGAEQLHQVSFVRRRYGRRTFTWIYINDECPCDPVAKIMPSKADIEFSKQCYEKGKNNGKDN